MALSGIVLESRGLFAVRDYLTQYAGSVAFQELAAETTHLTEDLARGLVTTVGHRSFELTEGAPQPTSHGEDLYQQIFPT